MSQPDTSKRVLSASEFVATRPALAPANTGADLLGGNSINATVQMLDANGGTAPLPYDEQNRALRVLMLTEFASGETSGIRGQLNCAITTWETVYAVPANRQGTYNILLCNRGTGGDLTVRIGLAKAAATDDSKQALLMDYTLPAHRPYLIAGVDLGPRDLVRAYSSAQGLSVTVVGRERDA